MVTQAELQKLLRYDKDTGEFFWKQRKQRRTLGKKVGSPDRNGYLRIGITRKSYTAHRLAWLYMYGYLPAADIDHINGITDDNSILNLRLCEHAENQHNRRINKNNTSGFKGVTWYKPTKKWNAQIRVNNKRKNLGYFIDKKEAALAYNKAALKYHGEFASLNDVSTSE